MAVWLTAAGCDAVHTLDLPDGNRTTDERINDAANREQRVLVAKDADFVDSHVRPLGPPGETAADLKR
jgi:predicted nuclease of predicted toxin-antitoxin system